jgi:hypothetical protein
MMLEIIQLNEACTFCAAGRHTSQLQSTETMCHWHCHRPLRTSSSAIFSADPWLPCLNLCQFAWTRAVCVSRLRRRLASCCCFDFAPAEAPRGPPLLMSLQNMSM